LPRPMQMVKIFVVLALTFNVGEPFGGMAN
jgi:hypothetical protein